MKTLMLNAEDIQTFGKLLPQTTTATINNLNNNIITNNNNNNIGNMSNLRNIQDGNLVALQYYLKHPNNYITTTTTPPTITSNNNNLKQIQQQQQHQLKQPNLNQQQHNINNYHHHHHHNHHQHHHHPYYQQQQNTTTTTNNNNYIIQQTKNQQQQLQQQQQQQQQSQQQQQQQNTNNVMPIHALNQNSNFSAASSSTGGGTTTASSHAPTQQSNTTGSSFSPPGATANKRTTPASNTNNNNNNNNNNISSTTTTSSASTTIQTTNNQNQNQTITTTNGIQQQVRLSVVSGTKKLKTEPVLSHFHQSERLSFANTHIVWNEEHWKRVVFQDERKFNLDGPDGFSYYFHDLRNYERSLSQRPRGNSVFVYIVVTAGGPIHLDVSTTKCKPETCIENILRERNNICNKLGHSDFLLQDHNWSATALPTAQEWLSAEGIKLQKWPTIAHDLNIMENIWGWLIREVYDGGRKFSRKDDLIFRIREAWARLPLDLLVNLYSTLPERITELYYTRGVYTNC